MYRRRPSPGPPGRLSKICDNRLPVGAHAPDRQQGAHTVKIPLILMNPDQEHAPIPAGVGGPCSSRGANRRTRGTYYRERPYISTQTTRREPGPHTPAPHQEPGARRGQATGPSRSLAALGVEGRKFHTKPIVITALNAVIGRHPSVAFVPFRVLPARPVTKARPCERSAVNGLGRRPRSMEANSSPVYAVVRLRSIHVKRAIRRFLPDTYRQPREWPCILSCGLFWNVSLFA